jgi:hypothetical protein
MADLVAKKMLNVDMGVDGMEHKGAAYPSPAIHVIAMP